MLIKLETRNVLEGVCRPSALNRLNGTIKLLLNFIVLVINSCFRQQPIKNSDRKVQTRSFMWFEEEQLNVFS